MKYGDVTLGRIEAVWNLLGGEAGVSKLLSHGLDVSPKIVNFFAPWKTIKLGTGLVTPDDFCKALEEIDYFVSDWARSMLHKANLINTNQETEMGLVVVSVADLGFRDGANWPKIDERYKQLGLELCPPEVGPQLCLQNKDQPKNTQLFVAMKPIDVPGGGPNIFMVKRFNDDSLKFDGFYVHPGVVLDSEQRLVFTNRNK